MARFRSHYLTKVFTYVSTQIRPNLRELRNDFKELSTHACKFPSLSKGCEIAHYFCAPYRGALMVASKKSHFHPSGKPRYAPVTTTSPRAPSASPPREVLPARLALPPCWITCGLPTRKSSLPCAPIIRCCAHSRVRARYQNSTIHLPG